AEGVAREWTPAKRDALAAQLRDAAQGAMRVLAFGYALLPPETLPEEKALRKALDQRLVYVGFVAIRDPLREDVRAAVEQCRRAGIDVKMITGDSVETAQAVGREVGLLDRSDELVLASPELNALNAADA